MFGKYSDDSVLMDFLPMQTNASSTSHPANTSDTCCLLKASPWPRIRSRLSKIGPNLGKSRMFNPSSVLPTSTVVSFMDIPKSPFRSRILPARVPLGTFPMSAIQPLKYLKRLSLQLRSSPIGSWTLKSLSKPTHLIMHSPLYFQLQLQQVNCTPLHSTTKCFLLRNSITMFMTKSYLRSLKLSNGGNIILKALHSQSTWS